MMKFSGNAVFWGGLIILFHFLSCTKDAETFVPTASEGDIESFFTFVQQPTFNIEINTNEFTNQSIPFDNGNYLVFSNKSFLKENRQTFEGKLNIELYAKNKRSDHIFHFFNGVSATEVFSPQYSIKLKISGSNGEIVTINPDNPIELYILSEEQADLKYYYQPLESKSEKWIRQDISIEYNEWNIQGTEESILVKGYKSKIFSPGKISLGLKKLRVLGLNSNICLNLPTFSSRMNTMVFLVDKENNLIFKTDHSNEHDFCINKEVLMDSELLEVIILADYGDNDLHYQRTQRLTDRLDAFEFLPRSNTLEYIINDIRQNID